MASLDHLEKRSRPRKRPLVDEDHQCPYCHNFYSRRDHLIRHIRSHTKERSVQCSVCGRSFVRKDLLLRHSLLHKSAPSTNHESRNETVEISRRVINACSPCAAAKTRCNDVKPCYRCQERGIECITDLKTYPVPELHGSGVMMITNIFGEPQEAVLPRTDVENEHDLDDLVEDNIAAPLDPQETDNQFLDIDEGDNGDNGNTDNMQLVASSELQFSDLFPSIIPLDGPTFVSRTRDSTLESQLSDHQRPPLSDIGNDLFFNTYFPLSPGVVTKGLESRGQTPGNTNSTQRAFQQSPWYSKGGKKTRQHTSPRYDTPIPSDTESIKSLSRNESTSVPQLFDQRTRDALLAMVAKESKLEDIFPENVEFPSPALMDVLAARFLRKQNRKIDSWIHTPSFHPERANFELTFMILAGGALSTQIASIRQWGYYVCRFIKRRILSKLEGEYDLLTTLPLLQALLIFLEVDSWNCDHSCLFHGGSLSEILHNFLRLSLRYDSWSYESIPPRSEDHHTELQGKWELWIASEGFKRLAARFCTFENQKAAALNIRPSITCSELRIPLPHPRPLWMAETASEWRDTYLVLHTNATPSFRELLAALPINPFPVGCFDEGFAIKLSAHFLEGVIIDHHIQSNTFYSRDITGVGDGDDERQQPWKTDIKAATDNLRSIVKLRFQNSPSTNALSSLTMSYLFMILNVFIGDFELLFGKAGAEESHRVYRKMQHWAGTRDAREAIWHAGQILRFLGYVERPLSNFVVVIVYQAGLVLLGYSWLKRQTKDIFTKFVSVGPTLSLNGPDDSKSDDFIQNGCWEPTLQYNPQGSHRTSLHLAPELVVRVVTEAMFNNTCGSQDLPQLLAGGLLQLLKDIAAGALQKAGDYNSI